MKRTSIVSEAVIALGAAALWTSAAAAAPAVDAASKAQAIPVTVFPVLDPLPTVSVRRGLFGSIPLTAAALATKRGGEAVSNDTQIKGAVSGNQANNVVTGNNSVSDGAFVGAAGISTVIQNSGNNVLIQNATIVNVQLK